MLRTILLIAFIPAFTHLSVAQVRATTESGNKVLLFDNGTWQYDEKSTTTTEKPLVAVEAIAVDTISIDTTRIFATEAIELFYLSSPRLVRYFGEKGGNVRGKLKCSNNLGKVQLHFIWEFPVMDAERYFGLFSEGTKVTLTLDNGQSVDLIMGEKSTIKRYEKSNYSMISNVSQPLTKMQIATLSAQPFRKIIVDWKKNTEEYYTEDPQVLIEMLPTVL